MSSALIVRYAVFFSVATSLMAGLHYYVFARFSRYLSLTGGDQRALRWVLTALFLLMWSAMPLSRLVGRQLSSPFLWVAYIWMGTLALVCVTLAGSDLVRLGAGLLTKLRASIAEAPVAGAIDPERRALFERILGLGTLGTAATLSGYALFEGLRRVAVKKVTVPLSRLPQEFAGFRIVQLTDVHIGPTISGPWLRGVVAQVNALNPDVVVITGDLVDGSVASLGVHVAPLADLRAPHGVFFVTGNHEYYAGADEWIAELARLKVRTLRNEHVSLPRTPGAQGPRIDLIGIDDYQGHSFPSHGPDLPRAITGRDAKNVAVLLAHQPKAVEEAFQHGIDLQLSGHTHGGQLWPWGHLVKLQQPYVAGLIRHAGSAGEKPATGIAHTMLYVSCGTGYWGPPMRLAAPAEITEITLQPASAAA